MTGQLIVSDGVTGDDDTLVDHVQVGAREEAVAVSPREEDVVEEPRHAALPVGASDDDAVELLLRVPQSGQQSLEPLQARRSSKRAPGEEPGRCLGVPFGHHHSG